MSKLTAIREALRAALPEDLKAEVLTGPQEPSPTFRAAMGPPKMMVRVYTGAPGDPEAQSALDRLIDDTEEGSIPKVLNTNRTLGGVINSLHIVSVSGWRIFETKDGHVLGAELVVQTQ